MKNQHLVPQVVIDCAENIKKNSKNRFVMDNYTMRLEAIRDYCDRILMTVPKHDQKN